MTAAAKISQWAWVLGLMVVGIGATAQVSAQDKLVWVDNESFGLEACVAAPATRSNEQIAATISMLRARAGAELGAALQAGGVSLAAQQLMTITPLSGALACGDQGSQITFRVVVLDQDSGKRWSTDMTVGSAPSTPDDATLSRLASDLARHFGAPATKAAML